MAAKKSKHGGRRPGAGRPPELVDPVRFTLDIDGADFSGVKALASERGVSKGTVVREAIRAYVVRRRKG
jgi:hypothetical protein